MSPIEISEIEQRLGAGLDRRAGQVTVPSSDQGRAAIDRRVTQRRHHRRVVRTTGAVLVVLAILAVGFGVTRGRDDGQKVVSGPNIDVPPLPHLRLPARDGASTILSLWPGMQEETRVRTTAGGIGDVDLNVVLSDRSLSQIEAEKVAPDDVVVPVKVRGAEGFALTKTTLGQDEFDSDSGVYWKPDAQHIAALGYLGDHPSTHEVNELIVLADQFVPVSDRTWEDEILNPSTPTNANTTDGAVRSIGLANPAARLGLPDGRTIPLSYQAPPVGTIQSVLDVPGYTDGTFMFRATLGAAPPSILDGEHGPSVVRVRGTKAIFQAATTGQRGQLSWVEDGIVVQITFTGVTDPHNLLPGSKGRLPSRAAVIDVADQLRSLSESTWRSLLSPPTVRTDVLTLPGADHAMCMLGPCPLRSSVSASTTTTGG